MPVEIIPLDCGHITQVERSGQFYLTTPGQFMSAQMVLWLIRGGDATVVVDSGPGTPEMVREQYGRELVQGPEQQPLRALEQLGVRPEDVDAVVQTHLHWDHCLGLEQGLFPNADLFVQRAELAYAASPYPPHAKLYNPGIVKRLLPSHAPEYPRVRVIDGDFKLSREVTLLKTPGHTPGTQATVVRTDSGTVVLASDNLPFHESWRGSTPGEWTPPGVHTNLEEWYASMARVFSLADLVLPSHDPAVLGKTYT
jgi:glyoxylase-like metal-dependent hydrolase (beta-lactamase superfamily II)